MIICVTCLITDINQEIRKEVNALFKDALHKFYLLLFYLWPSNTWLRTTSIRRENLLLSLHGLLFPISSKGSFLHTIPSVRKVIPGPMSHQMWITGWNEKQYYLLQSNHEYMTPFTTYKHRPFLALDFWRSMLGTVVLERWFSTLSIPFELCSGNVAFSIGVVLLWPRLGSVLFKGT